MKKIMIFAVIICFGFAAKAQGWQGNTHNGYYCYSLKTTDNIIIHAAKGIDGYMGEALFVKIKVPFNWGNISTGNVKYFKKNLITGASESNSSFFGYQNGWLYFVEFLTEWCSVNDRRGNYPCHTYTITLYEKNDHGDSGGRKITVNTNLDKLNATQMIMNETPFETYW